MRKVIMLVLLVLILVILNYSIYEKEQIKKHGSIVLLRLEPVDPRSLMQGDYMQLRYAIEQDMSGKIIDDIIKDTLNGETKESKNDTNGGYIVIRVDENNVAQFVRFHEGEGLLMDEKLLKFNMLGSSARISPDSFLFQEGHAKYYDNAEYGIFKFDESGKYILLGLADENRNAINP